MSRPMSTISDDEIFRRKLLMDGEGMGEERRLNSLFKNIYKWCEGVDESHDESNSEHSRLIMLIENCKLSMSKSLQMQKINQTEVEHYEETYKNIETRIAETQKEIDQKKAILQQSIQIRKNKQTYNTVATVIKAQPDRKATLTKLEEIKQKTDMLEKIKLRLTEKLEKQSKILHTVQHSASELKQIAQEEEETSDENDEVL